MRSAWKGAHYLAGDNAWRDQLERLVRFRNEATLAYRIPVRGTSDAVGHITHLEFGSLAPESLALD